MTLTLDRTPTSDLRADAWEDAIATTLDAPRAYDDTPRATVEQYPVISGLLPEVDLVVPSLATEYADLQGRLTGATGLEPATSGVTGHLEAHDG
jgi:hypothetical protein